MERQFSTESTNETKFTLNQDEAKNMDKELMSEYGYKLEQLMELAGLSCAQAILDCYPLKELTRGGLVLVCCGPGNNGGDGLVCARHLKLFGYQPSIFYPKSHSSSSHPSPSSNGDRAKKPVTNDFFSNLKTQIVKFDIPFLSYFPNDPMLIDKGFDLVIDAIFGFGFRAKTDPAGEGKTQMESSKDNCLINIKSPFDDVLCKMARLTIPIISIDVPSAWDVDGLYDPQTQLGPYYINPETLISLTAPKECSKFFKGKNHYLGGRFVPTVLLNKYHLEIPQYPGAWQCVKLEK